MKRCLMGIALVAAGGACSNAGSLLGFGPAATQNINVQVFLDRDRSGTFGAADTVYGPAGVSLRPVSGGQAIQTKTSGPQGTTAFENVPVGEYSITAEASSLGDSLVVAGVTPSLIRVQASQNPLNVTVRVAYPELSIRESRQALPGRRVLIRGLVLAGVQSFRDTTSYVQDTSGQIRLTRVSLQGGLTGNNPGDSVAVIGTVSSRAGQPVLDQASIIRLATRPAPIPLIVTTAVAASAQNGALDAALVQITGAIITDTATIAPDFRVVGDDGSGPITLVLDLFMGFNRAVFVPGRSMTARGVLVPTGTGQWELKPRVPGDVAVF
ncbi:MAG: hypothetical protein ACT4PM_07105 [Gemmatimonadales bacterium]